MVDVIKAFADISILSVTEGDLAVTFFVRNTQAGHTSERPIEERFSAVFKGAPGLMQKGHEAAVKQYHKVMKDPAQNRDTPEPEPPAKDMGNPTLREILDFLQYGDFDDQGVDVLDSVRATPADLVSRAHQPWK